MSAAYPKSGARHRMPTALPICCIYCSVCTALRRRSWFCFSPRGTNKPDAHFFNIQDKHIFKEREKEMQKKRLITAAILTILCAALAFVPMSGLDPAGKGVLLVFLWAILMWIVRPIQIGRAHV